MLYFFMVANKAACQTLSKAFLLAKLMVLHHQILLSLAIAAIAETILMLTSLAIAAIAETILILTSPAIAAIAETILVRT